MDSARADIADSRAHTDASLGAERASSDAAAERTAPRAQRVLDDVIERDRILADQRLLKFRGHADRVLAQERSVSPPRDTSVALERALADESTKAERQVTDDVLERERQRADSAVVSERQHLNDQRVQLEAHRKDTDDQLSSERHDADVVVISLDRTKTALAVVEGDKARRTDVFGMVTHDLRSPLTIITMNAESIVATTKEPPTLAAIEDVVLAAARMERLLSDLLDLARIDSGTLQIVKQRYAVGALVTEVHQWYQPLFAERGMAFVIKLPAEAIVATFDHDRIVQVLSNLLGNAMKFAPGGGTIGLHVEARAGQIEFVLHDNGPGIHSDILPNIFKRFFQIDRDARRGLGLGLYICRKIVEGHGGRIWAESDFGKGATFRFTLPSG